VSEGAKIEAPNVPIGEHQRSEVEAPHGAERIGVSMGWGC